jgi:hypothetical protein
MRTIFGVIACGLGAVALGAAPQGPNIVIPNPNSPVGIVVRHRGFSGDSTFVIVLIWSTMLRTTRS